MLSAADENGYFADIGDLVRARQDTAGKGATSIPATFLRVTVQV
jgi:hypothetical protein